MPDGPVGVVREGVHGLDRHHRAFERGHAVERHGHDEELEDRVRAQLLPGAGEGHDAVDHAAPGRREQHQREHHAQRLSPVGKRGVVQVMGARPDVGEDERPEVDHRQPVRVHRPFRLLGNEVVHHPEEAGGEEESDRVVAVPPLHHRVLHPGVERVRLGPGHGHGEVVEDVQNRDRQDEGPVEPVGDVDVLDLALGDRAEEHDRVRHPYHGDQDVDRPLELGVFLALSDAERQRDGGGDDHRLPAPERERRELVGDEADLAGALYDII